MCHIPIDYHELETLYGHMLNHSGRILGITSSRKEEGVTSMIRALGERLVCDGKRVLLVDINCENPTLSSSLVVKSANTVVTEKNFDILPLASFREDYNKFMQLKNVTWLRNCFEQHQKHYDWILVDTSPVMHASRHNVPADLVLSCCDSTYIMVKAGVTYRTEMIDAIKSLQHRGVNLLGTIYNDQNNPTLAQELERELQRLTRTFPKLGLWLKQRVRNSYALNMII